MTQTNGATKENSHDSLMKGFGTKAIHAGHTADSDFGAVIPPIYMTSTYKQDRPAEPKVYDYTRAGNPNFAVVEFQVAALEGGKHAVALSAGLACFTALCFSLKSGDKVVAFKSLYGGTYRLLTKVFQPMGVDLNMFNVGDWESLEKELALPESKIFFFETPTNPLMEVLDIERLAKLCKKYDVMCVADNTFATPYCQNPLSLGAHVVIHSSTKYLGGHSDVIGGCIITDDEAIADKVRFMRLAVGLNPSPFDAWLITRSLKTLEVRMRQHCKAGMELATWLQQHDMVEAVYYPGLPSHPNHEIAKAQSTGKGLGGMVSAEFKMSLEDVKTLISSFHVITLAESLGGVESLVDHPASMTHASIPAEERKSMGLNDGLVRFSFGLEDIEDIKADLQQAIVSVAQSKK